MRILPILMVMIVFSTCKLRRESTTEDKFGRIGGKISAKLAGQIDDAIKKFAKNGDTDEIAALIKKGGKVGDEATAAFRRAFTSKKTKMSTSLKTLEQEVVRLRKQYAGKNVDYDKLLKPWFADAGQAIDQMINTADKYYKALPKVVADSEVPMKKLYLSVHTDYLLNVTRKVADIESSAELAASLRKLETLNRNAYAASMKTAHNLPVEDYFLSRWWVELVKSTNTGGSRKVMKAFDDMMAKNPSKAGEFYLSFTKKNVEEIEEIIYTRIPQAKTVNGVGYHLDELIHELDKMKLNISARNRTVSTVFSEENVKALRKAHETYLLRVSTVGGRARKTGAEVLKGRVFGVWGDDIFDQVAKWEKQHGKMLDSVDDVEVRDMLYNLQELCKSSTC